MINNYIYICCSLYWNNKLKFLILYLRNIFLFRNIVNSKQMFNKKNNIENFLAILILKEI